MDINIKNFIEKNIDLIEDNQWTTFWEEACTIFLNNNYLIALVDLLESAGIDTRDTREQLLSDQISKVVTQMNSEKSVLRLRLSQFIDRIPLTRRFGFNLREIQVYILSHKDNWNCYIYLDSNYGWTVRRH